MKLTEVDGEEYLSFQQSILYVYFLTYEYFKRFLTKCLRLHTKDACGPHLKTDRQGDKKVLVIYEHPADHI